MSEEIKEETTLEVEQKDLDIFEKCFGKAPEVGYDFKYVVVGLYWRAIVISWGAAGIGFGEVALVIEDKKIKIDTECMSKDFCDALIAEAIKKLEEQEKNEPPLTEEEQICGRDSLNLRSTFLKTMYDNVDWGTEINPYVPPENEDEKEIEDV